MAQRRLTGTLPAPAEARKNHKLAVARVRQLEGDEDASKDGLKEIRAALKKARAELQRAEDDLDAVEDLTD